MNRWEYKLGDICEIHRGLNFKVKSSSITDSPILMKGNIVDNKIETGNLLYAQHKNNPNVVLVEKWDVVMTATSKAGRVTINHTDLTFLLEHNLLKLEPNPEILDKKYLYYFLLNNHSKVEKCITIGNGPIILPDSLKEMSVSIPNLEDQKAIVKKLDIFMELREELGLRKKQTRYYRECLMNFLSNQSRV